MPEKMIISIHMADELLDIVDENDKVIGSAMKSETHKKGLLHRTVIAEVIGKDRVWTLVEQSATKQDTGQYVSAIGGHVKSEETLVSALRREAKEEYGLSGNFKFKLIGKKIYNRTVKGNKENHYFIIYEIYTNKKPVLDEESVDYKIFSEKELARELKEHPEKFGPPFRFLIKNFYPNLMLNE